MVSKIRCKVRYKTLFCGIMSWLGLIQCTAAGEFSGVQFGPPSAEYEIRQAFGFQNTQIGFGELVRLASLKGMRHEAMNYDHSLIHCDLGPDRNSFNFELFFCRKIR